MREKPIIYTYGNALIKSATLLPLLKQHNINCVIDCRTNSNTPNGITTLVNELKEELRQQKIAYIPFFNHFGFIPSIARNRQGSIIYSQAIAQPNFLQGIERINNGIEKGFTICIIDNQRETYKSKRFLLIGKYLQNTYRIIHLHENGHYFSQEEIEQKNQRKEEERKQKNKHRQNIGSNGEEIAALYLARNNYHIIEHNWNLHRGCKLDIIAMKNNRLHFIEVKTRTSDKYGEPQTAINHQKMRNILKAIQTYRFQHYLTNTEYQIDSIAIIYRSEQDYDLKHFLNIRPNGEACDDCKTFHKRPTL